MNSLTQLETRHLRTATFCNSREMDGALMERKTCEKLAKRGLLHIIDDGDYWAVAQTPTEASAARSILIPGYQPSGAVEWLAELEKAPK